MNGYVWILVALLAIWLAYSFYKRYKLISSGSGKPESEKLTILTDATFKKQISKGVSLVDFWADWCTPCKIQGPVVSELADEMNDKAKICKLDVQHNQRIPGELGIRNIPTIMIFKDGKMVNKFVGVKTKSVLLKGLKAALES
ncbi:MAG: thioredoxin [Bacteroidales bacterium]|nr:thioredoxin [Bacteroidales bacterium]